MKNFRRLAVITLLVVSFNNASATAALLFGGQITAGAVAASWHETAATASPGGPRSFLFHALSYEYTRGAESLRSGTYLASIMSMSELAATTYTVNSIADTNDGACTTGVNGCTLREAIIAANANAGADTIAFNLPAGLNTIGVLSQLPAITQAVTINGANVIVNGAVAGAGANGLLVTGSDVHISSLNIISFSGAAIRLEGSGGNVVEGCRLGRTSTSEPVVYGNGTGVFIASSPNNLVSGTGAGGHNVISGNNDGVRIEGLAATGNRVEANFVGTDVTGASDLGNTFNGVVIIGAPNNTVGGASFFTRNYISGNDQNGVAITGVGATGNSIQNNTIGQGVNPLVNHHDLGNTVNGVYVLSGAKNNFIGTAGAGNKITDSGDGVHIKDATTSGNSVVSNEIIGNVRNGVVMNNSPNNTIGSAGDGRNFVAENGFNGVAFTGASATGNHVQGNTIGAYTDTFDTFHGNTQNGVIFVSSASNNTVSGNTISGNHGDGIRVESGTGNRVDGNSVGGSDGLGINLGTDGVTPNDVGDTDSGVNNLQNFPVISSVRSSVTLINDQLTFNTRVQGSLNSAPNSTYTIGIYAGGSCDSSGNGEGASFVGSFTTTTGSNGNAVFDNTLFGHVSSINSVVTATATDSSGNTSEFSQCVTSAAPQSGSLRLSAENSSVNEATAAATITVLREGGSDGTVTVTYETSNLTATPGQDYTNVTGTLSFGPGETVKTFSVPIVNDSLDEPDETLHIGINSPTGGATLGTPSGGSLTIVDNDATPTISITDVSVTEGDDADKPAVFTISLSAASGQTVTVHYTTANGTAIADSDYQPDADTIGFGPGETQKTITIAVLPDTVDESNENFFVNLSNATNATIADGQGVGTIVDNDTGGVLRFSAATYSVSEGGGAATITVTRTGGAADGVSVHFATSNGTAIGGTDYDPRSDTLSFGAGEMSKTFAVSITDDGLFETNETINLTLSSPTGGATLGSPVAAVLTINNNDTAPSISIDDVAIGEGDAGTTQAIFNVYLSNASGLTTTVNYATANGTAVAPGDYAATSGTLTFSPGETTKSISVAINGDPISEGNETLSVNLTSPSNATLGDAQGVGIINNDDLFGTIQFEPASYTTFVEGGGVSMTVHRVSGSRGTVTVEYATSDGTASAGQDYEAKSGTLTFNEGEETASITVGTLTDTLDEPSETFFVTLSHPTGGATLGSANQATINIPDNDPSPTLSIRDNAVTEGNSGTKHVSFHVDLSAVSGQTVTVQFNTSDGTANAGQDYVAKTATLSFSPGTTQMDAEVIINGDTVVEPNETIIGKLSGTVNATIADDAAVCTVLDDDASPTATPTLGIYQATTVALSDNISMTPSAAPTGVTSLSVSTTAGFKGRFEGDAVTGVIRLTNAQPAKLPAGAYTVTVQGFGPGGTATQTFMLTVNNGAACATPQFNAASNFPVGTNPRSVVVGDFNGDGIQDLAIANFASNNISILLGTGLGGFGAASTFNVGQGPNSLAAGDFNADGIEDLATANKSSGNVSVLLGTGTGSFGTASNLSVDHDPESIAVDDFNADGIQDIATANGFNSDGVSILLGTGILGTATGNFHAATSFRAGTTPFAIATGDFNGDGIRDIATANRNSDNVSILLGTGTGSFGAPANFGVGSNPEAIALGDFNGDGFQDIAAANYGSHNISILLGTGTGTLASAINFAVGSSPASVAVGDFNGDGKQDIATADTIFSSSNSVAILLGTGSGSFGAALTFGVEANPQSLAVGDFNVDGRQDIVAASYGTNQVSVLLANCGSTTTPSPTPTATPTPTPTATPTPTPTPTPSPTPTPTPSPTPSATPTPSPTPTATPTPTPSPSAATFQFGSSDYVVAEGAGFASITVTRSGDTSSPAAVDFQTSDVGAHQRTDYILSAGTLHFAANETTMSFRVLIVDDVYVEGSETLTLTLTNPTNAQLTGPSVATLTIMDNDSTSAIINPLDTAPFFVQQHYYDFLSRYPDQSGWDYWSAQITQCGTVPGCIQNKRIDVSNAFIFELEYQQGAAFVFRLYRAAFGNNQPFSNPDATNPQLTPAQQAEARKLPSYAVFSQARARLIGSANLAQDQLAMANAFVERPEFISKYPTSLTLAQFVDQLLATINSSDGVDLSAQRAALINLGGRGSIVYRLANDDGQGSNGGVNNRAFIDAEYNRSFVAAQYFGYLRRDPDIAGFSFWLGQISSALLRDLDKQHALVCSQITSAEYQLRFGPVVTHSNSECGH